MTWTADQTQKCIPVAAKGRICLWCWKKRLDPPTAFNCLLALGDSNNSRLIVYYIMGEMFLFWKQMPKRSFIDKEISQCQGFRVSRLSRTGWQCCLETVLQAPNWNPLWSVTVRTPGPSSIFTSTHCQCATGAVGPRWPVMRVGPEQPGTKEQTRVTRSNYAIHSVLLNAGSLKVEHQHTLIFYSHANSLREL